MSVTVDAAIIGGGIVGLMTAIELKERHPAWEVVLFEQAPFLGDHASGRNSGVLHSGLYYPTNSLKHRLCLTGLESWKKLIQRHDLPHRFCGKTIFARNATELSRLQELEKQAEANQVPHHRASTAELSSIREHANAHEALIIESTGILDVATAMAKLRAHFENLGGMVQTAIAAKIISYDAQGFELQTPQFKLHAHRLVNAAGLWATQLRQQLGLTELTHRWVKGHYLKTSQKLGHTTLYYPLPLAGLEGLGVHSTIDCAGEVKFGPDTANVLEVDYRLEPSQLEEMRRVIDQTFKGVDSSRLMPDYAGIRSKILSHGAQHIDFWVKGPSELTIPGYAEACGIESPGMTAAPAIAQLLNKFLA